MKHRIFVTTFSFLIVTALTGLVAQAQTQSVSVTKWEYKTLQLGCYSNEEGVDFNKLGELGWELVTFERQLNQSSSSSCITYIFKRPKGSFPAEPSDQQPAAPKCSLTQSQSPVIRGIRLGMSADEVLALFPGSKDQFRVRESLDKSKFNHGVAGLEFKSDEYPESKDLFNNVGSFGFTFFDGRVVAFRIEYRFPRGDRDPSWTIESWIGKFSEAFRLPGPSGWEPPNGKSNRKLSCRDFAVEVWAYNYSPSISISNPAYFEEVKRRREAELKKRQAEFKP